MLEIKHTLCPSCSVGCGLNVVLNDGEIVGTFPYKRHPVNAGKNCLNGRNSIDCYLNKFGDVDVSKLISEVSKELDGVEASDVTLLCSGNNSLEEIEAIAKFGESKNYNVAFYADNLKNFSATNLPDGLTIDGETKKTECELSETLHRIILRKAVELAKQVWVK